MADRRALDDDVSYSFSESTQTEEPSQSQDFSFLEFSTQGSDGYDYPDFSETSQGSTQVAGSSLSQATPASHHHHHQNFSYQATADDSSLMHTGDVQGAADALRELKFEDTFDEDDLADFSNKELPSHACRYQPLHYSHPSFFFCSFNLS